MLALKNSHLYTRLSSLPACQKDLLKAAMHLGAVVWTTLSQEGQHTDGRHPARTLGGWDPRGVAGLMAL